LAAAAAPACFFTVMMVLGLVTPGYNWVARIGSELSLGSLGWIMIANFIALGAVELALAAALGRTIGDRASGRVATAAIGLLGAAFVVAGVCVTDPHKLVSGAHTWHGVVHSLMAVVIFFIATPVAGFAMARRLRHQRRFARFSALTAVATPALLIATFVTGSLLGLAERVVIAVALAWLTSLAIWLRRGHLASLDPSPQPSWRFRCARCWCGAGGDGFKLNMIRPHRPRAGHERLSGLITATASPGPAYRLRRRHRQGLPSREDG
jgi:hypothetical membrane protein